MLAEGRLGEAVEYLALSQRLCYEAHDAPGMLWTLAYLAESLFIDGRFTQCLSVIEQGLAEARKLFRREVELFLLFLRARTRFQVGCVRRVLPGPAVVPLLCHAVFPGRCPARPTRVAGQDAPAPG